ncbi:MATE family efflux transporter [Shimazuella kribbensis]|uniref:MATE family efflux transporter n=1 Tax=Shimazuella kribbensis TaxID=139808 RepID=UPI0004912376|nr:MATE family efflux transporter [Shimazuella kribbensis]
MQLRSSLQQVWKHPVSKTVIEMFFGQLLLFVDGLLVASLGLVSINAVGVTSMLLLSYGIIVYSIAIASANKVGKIVGENRSTELQKEAVVVQAFYLTSKISLVLGVMTLYFAPQLLEICRADPETVEQGSVYLCIVGGLYLLDALRIQAACSLRAVKEFNAPVWSAVWMNVVHFVLAPVALYGLNAGLKGAGWATVLSQSIGLLLLLRPLRRSYLGKIPWKWNWSVQRMLITLSWREIVRGAILRVTLVYYASAFFLYGPKAYEAFRIHEQFVHRSYVFLDAFVFALSPLVSTLYGKNNKEEDRKLVRLVTRMTLCVVGVMGSLGLLMWAGSDWIIGFYTDDPTTAVIAKQMFLTSAFWLPPFTCFCVLNGVLRSVEELSASMVIGILTSVVWMGSVILIQQMQWGVTALLISYVAFDMTRGSLVTGCFFTGWWRKKKRRH